MLPAEKQEDQASTAVTKSNAATTTGFGKVLGSIQGLQQRLNDFTLDDVYSAENNLKTRMREIVLLRDRLDIVAELKNAVTEANHPIHGIAEQAFDVVGPDSLEKHPRLHAIVKASKLIQFYRSMKAARASAEAVSFDSEAGELHIDTAAAQILAPALSREMNQEENRFAPETSLAIPEGLVHLGAQDSDRAIVIEAPAQWTFEAEGSDTTTSSTPVDETALDLTSANAGKDAGFEACANPVEKNHLVSENWATLFPPEFPLHAAAAPTLMIEPSTVALIEAAENFPSSDALPIGPTAKSAISEAEKPRHLSRKQKKLAKQTKLTEAETRLDESKALVPANSTINQRLLDDLIESYGDFATTPNLPVPVQAAKPPQVKTAKPTVLSTPESEKLAPLSRSAPNLQKAGELDRQLKKLIKDYGEYDIYSKQSSLNLKTGGIAVFVVLGLVLGALYLFKSPSKAGSSPTHAATQPYQAAPSMSPNMPSSNGAGSDGQSGPRE